MHSMETDVVGILAQYKELGSPMILDKRDSWRRAQWFRGRTSDPVLRC